MPRPCLGPAFCLASVEQTTPVMQHPPEGQQSAARCEPMSCIVEHLYIGSWRDLEAPESLVAQGITHILNVAKEVDPTVHDRTLCAFHSLHIPLVDEHRENILKHLEKACEFIESAKESGGRCLVHCRRGISRSPAIVVGYLMMQEHKEYESALEFVTSRRSCVSLNIAFREFLSGQKSTPRGRGLESLDSTQTMSARIVADSTTASKRTCPFAADDETDAEGQEGPTPGCSEPETAPTSA